MACGQKHNVLILDNELDMGGVEKKLYEFLSRIDRSHYSVSVCCLKRGGFLKDSFVRMGFPFYEGILTHKYDALAYPRFARILRNEGIDLIYTFAHPNTMFFSWMAKRTGAVKAWIVSFHATGNVRGEPLLRGYQRALLSRVDAMIAVAHTHKRHLIETEGLEEEKIRVIHNGVDTAKYHPGNVVSRIRNEFGIEHGETVVTTIASLKPVKGIDVLLAAAARVLQRAEGVRFLIVGEGPDRDDLQSQARSLGIDRRVTFAGLREDVEAILRSSDLFVLPSRNEAFPNAVLEAMASGLAVVSTDVGSVREIIVDGENGLVVPPMDTEALASAAFELLDDRDKREAFGRKGRELVERNFVLESMCRNREELFSELLCGRVEAGNERKA